MNSEETVRVIIEGQVGRLIVNRPYALNALNPDVLQSLILGIERLDRETHCRAIVVSGEGEKAFIAGADIASMAQLGPRAIADYVELGQRTMRALERARVPVVAAVHGYALGGGLELALACDLIIAADNVKLGQPEVNLGIIPGFGGTQRLVQRCGIGTARRLVYTGDLVEADEALRLGLVEKVVPRAQLVEEAMRVAGTISQRAPLAVARAKKVLAESQQTMLLSGLRQEVEAFLDLFATADREEGMTAFLQKRPALFSGK